MESNLKFQTLLYLNLIRRNSMALKDRIKPELVLEAQAFFYTLPKCAKYNKLMQWKKTQLIDLIEMLNVYEHERE